MKVILNVQIAGTQTEIVLKKLNEVVVNHTTIWEGYPEEHVGKDMYKVRVVHLDFEEISVDKGSFIETKKTDIRDQFVEYLIEIEKQRLESKLQGIEDTEEVERKEKTSINPYDPELIRVDPRQFSIKYIQEMLESDENELDLSPDFQRNFVWNDITRKSRLIESLLLRIPLPVFYFSQDNEGRFQVVDGVQRLTVIQSYLNNEFKLRNLEYLKECEGKYFNKPNVNSKENLDTKYVRRINTTQLNCNVIDPQTPPKVKFDIFKRINTGGKTLNHQEIRNCFASTKVRGFLRKLVNSEEFIKATGGSVSSSRMADQDLVLRFIGFYYLRNLGNQKLTYRSDMDNFLDHVLMILNEEKEDQLLKIEKSFIQSMKNAYYLFGRYAFRKCMPEHLKPDAKKQMLNKSLFVTISVSLSKHVLEDFKENSKFGLLKYPFAEEIESNPKYYDALTNGTTDQKRLSLSFKIAEKIISRELGLN